MSPKLKEKRFEEADSHNGIGNLIPVRARVGNASLEPIREIRLGEVGYGGGRMFKGYVDGKLTETTDVADKYMRRAAKTSVRAMKGLADQLLSLLGTVRSKE